jgi:hypothetical protein
MMDTILRVPSAQDKSDLPLFSKAGVEDLMNNYSLLRKLGNGQYG